MDGAAEESSRRLRRVTSGQKEKIIEILMSYEKGGSKTH